MTEGFYKTDTFKTSNDDTWTTPIKFFEELNAEFNFTLDSAALSSSALCNLWYGPDHPNPDWRDAFNRDWVKDSNGGAIWLNPPYGRTIKKWMAKAEYEALRGGVIVSLVPARTDTIWWHSHCINYQVRFIKGRLKFGNQKNSAPFPSAIVILQT